jgi:hypothetical protein
LKKKKGSINHTLPLLAMNSYFATWLLFLLLRYLLYWVCKYEYRWNRFTFLRGKLRDSLAPGVDPFSSHMLGGKNNSLIGYFILIPYLLTSYGAFVSKGISNLSFISYFMDKMLPIGMKLNFRVFIQYWFTLL